MGPSPAALRDCHLGSGNESSLFSYFQSYFIFQISPEIPGDKLPREMRTY